jgi:hypothetical protein
MPEIASFGSSEQLFCPVPHPPRTHNVHISAVRVSRFLQFCLSVFAQVCCHQAFDQAIVLAQIIKEIGKLCAYTGAIPLKTFDFRLQKRL